MLADAVPARGIEPAAALHALAGPGSVLLESGEGRWSYLAPWPAAVLSRRDPAGALEEARALLDRLAADVPAGAPPFTGGLLGSLGYDLARALEPIPQIARDDLGLPAIQLAAVDSLYAFDRERDELWIVARAERELRRLRDGLERVRPVARPAAPGDELRGMPYAHYRARVERVLDHIARGDVYEVNYTQRLEGNCSSALDLYARLRESAPVPYNLYLDAGGWQLVGATPETFLRVGADGRCETRPIKGTRPRDDDPAVDARARGRPRDAPEGPRRERDDRRPRAQRPLARVRAGDGARAVAVRGRVAPDRPPARLDRDRSARPRPRRSRPRGGGVRPGLDDRRAQGARDAADRAARAGAPRPLRRRLRLARPRTAPATWRS